MAKKAMYQRHLRNEKLVDRYQQKRMALKHIIKKSDDLDAVMEAQLKLAKLPVNSNPVRNTTRCKLCGRPHAVYKKFELCRICLRQQLMVGNVPGGKKSSW